MSSGSSNPPTNSWLELWLPRVLPLSSIVRASEVPCDACSDARRTTELPRDVTDLRTLIRLKNEDDEDDDEDEAEEMDPLSDSAFELVLIFSPIEDG